MDLPAHVDGIHVLTGLDVIHQPVPLGRVLHVVQLVADAPGVDFAQALHRVACRLPQGLETNRGRGDRLEVRPRDAVKLGLNRRVSGARSAQRIDLYVEVTLRAEGFDERAGGSGGAELLGHGLSAGRRRRSCGRGGKGNRR